MWSCARPAANNYPKAEGSEAESRQLSIHHTATHPAKIGSTVLDELKAEIKDDDGCEK